MKNTDYRILVNGDHRLPDNYTDTIELISVENAVGQQYQIEKKTYEAFLRPREDLLQNDGIQTELISVYRTVAQQEKIYARYAREHGEEYARTYVAIPGHSEHHTGIAIDVGILQEGRLIDDVAGLLAAADQFAVIQAKLPRYGFILRYPKGKEDVTRIGYESWHFRYIDSPEIATAITEQGLCFEEYWETL